MNALLAAGESAKEWNCRGGGRGGEDGEGKMKMNLWHNIMEMLTRDIFFDGKFCCSRFSI